MNDGALGFGVDDTSCLGLSDDEDVQRAPSDGSRARGGPAAPAPAAPAPSDAGLGSGQLALRALEMLRRTRHPTAAPSDAAVATPRAATSQPVQDDLREPPAFAGAARVASQAAPPPAPATRATSSPRAAGLGTGTGRPGGVLPAVAMTVGTGAPLPGAIPGPAGSISPDAALVPPTQFLRGPCKKKRVSRTPDDAGRARGVGADPAGLFYTAAGGGGGSEEHPPAAEAEGGEDACGGGSGCNGDGDGDSDDGSGEGARGAGGADASLILQSKLGTRAADAGGSGGTGAGAGAVDEAVFREGAWVAMLQTVRAPPFGAHRFATSVARVLAGGFREKVGEIAVAVRACADLGDAVRLRLADVTGAIDGLLARSAAVQRPDVAPGAVLVLRAVSVFSTSPRAHYLNILARNIAHVFAPGTTADVLPLAAELALETQRRALYAPPGDTAPVPASAPARRTAAAELAHKPPNRLRIEAAGPPRPRPPQQQSAVRQATPSRRSSSGGSGGNSGGKSVPQQPQQQQVPELGSQRFRGTIAPVITSTQPGSQTVRIAAKPRAPVIVAPSPAAARSQGSPTQSQSQGRPQPVVVGTPLRRGPVLISHPFTPARTGPAAVAAGAGAQAPPPQERATSSPPRTQTIVIARPLVVSPAQPPQQPLQQQQGGQTAGSGAVPADEEPDFDAFLDSVL